MEKKLQEFQEQQLAVAAAASAQLEALQRQLATQQAEINRRDAASRRIRQMAEAFERTVTDVGVEQLPILTVPKGEQLLQQGQLQRLLHD